MTALFKNRKKWLAAALLLVLALPVAGCHWGHHNDRHDYHR